MNKNNTKRRAVILIALVVISYQGLATYIDSSFHLIMKDRSSLFVRMAGTGKACLFLHGGPGSTDNYFEKTKAAELLQQHFTMIYFDQRGCGRSESAKSNDYSIRQMTNDMEEIRSKLNISKWVIMGHSFAGIFMANYAIRYAERCTMMVFINPTFNFTTGLENHRKYGLQILNLPDTGYVRDESVPLIKRVQWVHARLRNSGLTYRLMFRNSYEKKINDSLNITVPQNNFFGNAVWNLKEYFEDYTALTAQIKLPCIVFYGSKDFAAGPEEWRKFRFAKARYINYFGGHMPFQEEPQWFYEKITDYLRAQRNQ